MMRRWLAAVESPGVRALFVCFLAYLLWGWSAAWAIAFVWATFKGMEYVQEIERFKVRLARAEQIAEEHRTGIIRVKGYEDDPVPQDARSGRINGKLKAQNVSLQKINTDLQAEVGKRDRIIADLESRLVQKSKRERPVKA